MSGTQTPLSLNEILFFYTRAAVGAGAPFGLGEDFAKAAIWLASMGLDPAEITAPSLNMLSGGASSAAIVRQDCEIITFCAPEDEKPLSALYAGPSIADYLGIAVSTNQDMRFVVKNADQPVLIAAYVAAVEIEKGFVVIEWNCEGEDLAVAEITSGGVKIFATNGATNFGSSEPGDVEIRYSREGSSTHRSELVELDINRPNIIEDGVIVDEKPWAVVFGYFRKCLVPSSDQSRAQGAGAGLTDDD